MFREQEKNGQKGLGGDVTNLAFVGIVEFDYFVLGKRVLLLSLL